MRIRDFFKPGTLLFLALWFMLMIAGRSRFFQDPGTFWHTVVGQRIFASGFIDADPFTFTFAGTPWVPYQWLGECIMAVMHAIGGFDTFLLATSTILAALFTWLGLRLMRCGLHPSIAVVLVALAIAASSGHFHARPLVVTIAGFAITLAFLTDCEAKRISLGRLVWLIPIYFFWSNVHGGVLGGLATLAIAFLAWTIFWLLGAESPVTSWRSAGYLALIGLGCGLTTLMNPYGYRLPGTWIYIYQMELLPHLIQEHKRIDLSERNAWMILLFGGVYIFLLASTWGQGSLRSRLGQFRVVWFLPLIWLGLSCLRVRHAPLFAVSALVCLADFFPHTRLARHWLAKGSDLFEIPPAVPESRSLRDRFLPWFVPCLLVVSSLFLQAAAIRVPIIGHGWAQLDPSIWPVDLLDDLRAGQHTRPEGTRIFNEYAHGGFLIYYTPGYRVFVDDRCEVFGDAWLADFIYAAHQEPIRHLEEWQAKYGNFDYALINTQEGSSGFLPYFELSPEWKLVRQGVNAALFQRVR